MYKLISLALLLVLSFPVLAGTFLQSIDGKLKVLPKPADAIKYRLLKEYGALWLSKGEVILPPKVAFDSAAETKTYQSSLQLSKVNPNCSLQAAAYKNLLKASAQAKSQGLTISPRGNDACLRDYEMTHKLWLSRVEPNLNYYVGLAKLSQAEASVVRKAPIWEQVRLVLKLEKEKGLLFDKFRQTSILNSVAAPGSSQHLSGLAFDLAEFENPKVRKIMNQFGWFQTVQSDLPHFTYLGNYTEEELREAGLKKVSSGSFVFFVPNI